MHRQHDTHTHLPGLVTEHAATQQNSHVDNVKVGQDVGEAARQAERQRHHQVAEVVGVAADAPPARGQQVAGALQVVYKICMDNQVIVETPSPK